MSDTCCSDSSFPLHRWSASQVHAAVVSKFLYGGDDFILPCYFWVLLLFAFVGFFFVYVGTMKPLQ